VEDDAGGVAIQPDGRLVVAGATFPGANGQWALARLNGDMADLSLTASAPARTGPRTAIPYTFTVHNAGPEAALGVTLTDALPAGLSLRSATASQGTCSGTTCALGNLAAGGNATVTVTAASSRRGTVANGATVADALPFDPNRANNSASASTVIANPSASGFRFSPATFFRGTRLPRVTAPRRIRTGTTIRFRLSQAARVRISFARARRGRRVGRRCRKPTRRNRGRRRCTRYVGVKSRVSVAGKAGLNTVRFQGRISRKRRLPSGRYRATLVAVDSAGNRSRAKRAKFRLLIRPRRKR
jgi:uncharacterized repeat protein (TIGR01451 family)